LRAARSRSGPARLVAEREGKQIGQRGFRVLILPLPGFPFTTCF
jgi:flavodoxin